MTLLEKIKMLRKDIDTDASSIDGKNATGKFLGEIFGTILANIDILAGIVEKHLEQCECQHGKVQCSQHQSGTVTS